jgi:hypothetical protein
MKIFARCLATGLVLGLPLASAFADDASYCQELAKKARYVSDSGGAPPADVPVAISKCESGADAASIATLEKYLKDNKVTLPARN